MIRITVCDDVQKEVDDITKLCERFISERGVKAEIIGITNPLQLLDTKPDAIILDIEMPEISGIKLKEQMENMENCPYIIFATNYEDSMAEAFGEKVIGFLKKPVEYFPLENRLNTIVNRLTSFTLITCGDGSIVNSMDVVSITVERVYSQIELSGGRKISGIRKSLTAWEKELKDYGFIQISKSHLVNLKYIKDYKNGDVYLEDDATFTVSFRRRADFQDAYMQYCKKIAKFV